jgi:hypothetical protein
MALRIENNMVRTVMDNVHSVTNVPNIIPHAMGGLQTLCDRHPTFLLRQCVELLQGILDIRSSYQRF